MLEIILLVIGIVKAVRRPKLRRLTEQDFPNVDSAKFVEWHETQLKATDIFLWATWGAFFIKLFLGIAIGQMGSSPEAALTFVVLILVGWIVGLIVAAVHGGKAKKLRIAAGINWSK